MAEIRQPVYFISVPRLPIDHLLTMTVDYDAIEHRIMAQLGVIPMTEEERRRRLISGQSLIEGANERPMGTGIPTSSLAISPDEWVGQAASILRMTEPDLDLRPGTVARTLLTVAAAHLPIDPHEVTLDRLRGVLPLLNRTSPIIANGIPRRSYRGEDADVTRMREQIRADEDEEVHRRLDEIARDGTWPQEHLQIPMPVRQELTVLAADPPREPLGFTIHEEVGAALFNPRALERLRIPEFEIASNPTVNLRTGEIRNRRYPLTPRASDHPFILAIIRSQHRRANYPGCPCGCGAENEVLCWNPPRDAGFIGEVNTGPRRSVWERLLED